MPVLLQRLSCLITGAPDILRERSTAAALKSLAISYLHKQGSFAYTFEILKGIEQRALDEIQKLGGNPELVEFINLISCPNLHSDSALVIKSDDDH